MRSTARREIEMRQQTALAVLTEGEERSGAVGSCSGGAEADACRGHARDPAGEFAAKAIVALALALISLPALAADPRPFILGSWQEIETRAHGRPVLVHFWG
jgi:hypothetical protein